MAMLGILGKFATLVIYLGIYSVNVSGGHINPLIGRNIEFNSENMEMEQEHPRIVRTTQDKINICGPRLREAIEKTCRHLRLPYYSPDLQSFSRHSHRSAPMEGLNLSSAPGLNNGKFLNQKRPEPKMLIRLSRSVIEECCISPCSPSALMKYCSDIKPKTKTTATTTTIPPSIMELKGRRPRKEPHSNRKQQRKRNRVRINLPEDSSLDNAHITALECLLDADCFASLKLNFPSENTLTTDPQYGAKNENDSCANVPPSKGNPKRGRSSRKKKQGAPSYLLPLLIRIIGFGMKGQSGWQEAVPVRSMGASSQRRFSEHNLENQISDRSFTNLGYYQRKAVSDETERDRTDEGNPLEPWDKETTLEDVQASAYSASPSGIDNGQREGNTPRESYRQTILPVTDAPLLSYFAINLGTNDGINYEQKK